MGAIIKPMRHCTRPAPASPLSGRPRPAAQDTPADGRKRLSGRAPAVRGHQIHHHVTGSAATGPRAEVRLAAPHLTYFLPPAAVHPSLPGAAADLHPIVPSPASPCRSILRADGRRLKSACGVAARALRAS